MSAMSVSKSYAVLLGLEGYTRTKKKLGGVGRGVRKMFLGERKGTKDGVGIGVGVGVGKDKV